MASTTNNLLGGKLVTNKLRGLRAHRRGSRALALGPRPVRDVDGNARIQATDRILGAGVKYDSKGRIASDVKTVNARTRALGFVRDGDGSAISTGSPRYVQSPFSGKIIGWSLGADQSGSVVIDVWRDSTANYPPTAADTIITTGKPTLSSQTNAESTDVSGWDRRVSVGDWFGFNVDSASTVTWVRLAIEVEVEE